MGLRTSTPSAASSRTSSSPRSRIARPRVLRFQLIEHSIKSQPLTAEARPSGWRSQMINLLAVAVLASNSIVPCATVADHNAAASADVIMQDAIDSVEVEEALILAEENFAAHVGDLGLAGAAPLFGT